jgi:hypothetical protein
MKDGKCPKCNATTDCYICISCGYFENYLVDPDRLHAITRDWEKVD